MSAGSCVYTNIMKTYETMRKYLLFTLLLVLVAGCSKNNDSDPGNPEITLNVSTAPIEFPVEGGSRDVTVTTNATSWNVESNQAWCRVMKETGKFIVSALLFGFKFL